MSRTEQHFLINNRKEWNFNLPIYTFRNNTTGEEFTESMSISKRDEYLKENQHIEQLIVSAPLYGDAYRLGITKVPGDFRNLMNQIKKNNHGSTIERQNISEL